MFKNKLTLIIILLISIFPVSFAQEEEELTEEEKLAQSAQKLPLPGKTELIMAHKDNKQEGVENYYYKYWSRLKKEEILDFYRYMFPVSKGYREERRGLPNDDTKRNHFFFIKGNEEFVFLGFFNETESKGKLTYFLNISKIDVSKIPKEPSIE